MSNDNLDRKLLQLKKSYEDISTSVDISKITKYIKKDLQVVPKENE